MNFWKLYLLIIIFNNINAFTEKPFVVVIPSYNNSKWYQENLDSVFKQKYNNYRIIYIDDCSPDNTGNLVENYIFNHDQLYRCTLIKNEQRCLKMANMYKAIYSCKNDEIVIMLDGDDCFAHENVIARMNQEYQNETIWATYGSYRNKSVEAWGNLPPFCYKIPDNFSYLNYRNTDNVMCGSTPGHPFSFYAWLFKKINYKDFLYKGNFVQMAPDGAILWPIIELSWGHAELIPEVLCIYNDVNELNENKVNYQCSLEIISFLKKLTPYEPLNTVFNLPKIATQITDLIILILHNNLNGINKLIQDAKKNQNIKQIFIIGDSTENETQLVTLESLRKDFPEYYILNANFFKNHVLDQFSQEYINFCYNIALSNQKSLALLTSCIGKSPTHNVLIITDSDSIVENFKHIEEQNLNNHEFIFAKKQTVLNKINNLTSEMSLYEMWKALANC